MAWCGVIVHYEVFPADVDPTQASLPLPTLTLLIDRVDTEKSRINILSDIDVSMFYYIKIPFSSMPDWWPDIKSVELARDSQVVASLFIANGGLEMRMQPVISGGGGSLPPGNILIDASFTPINAIPVYSGLTGQVTSSSSSSPATLPRPLAITTSEENALILTTDQLKSIIKLLNSNPASNRATIDYNGIFEAGTDSTSVGNFDYFIYNILSAQQVLNVSAYDNLLRAPIGFVSSRYDIENSNTKPGSSATTLWRRQSDARLMNNNEPIAHLSDVSGVTQQTATAVFTMWGTLFGSNSGTVPISFVKTGRMATMTVAPCTVSSASDALPGALGYVIDGTWPAGFVPNSTGHILAKMIVNTTSRTVANVTISGTGLAVLRLDEQPITPVTASETGIPHPLIIPYTVNI